MNKASDDIAGSFIFFYDAVCTKNLKHVLTVAVDFIFEIPNVLIKVGMSS